MLLLIATKFVQAVYEETKFRGRNSAFQKQHHNFESSEQLHGLESAPEMAQVAQSSGST
jgi:hypothetical protein